MLRFRNSVPISIDVRWTGTILIRFLWDLATIRVVGTVLLMAALSPAAPDTPLQRWVFDAQLGQDIAVHYRVPNGDEPERDPTLAGVIEIRLGAMGRIDAPGMDGQRYDRFMIDGCGLAPVGPWARNALLDDPALQGLGAPELPFKGLLLEALDAEGELTVEVVDMRVEPLDGFYRIYPRQAPMSDSLGGDITFIQCQDTYQSGGWLPRDPVTAFSTGVMRGTRLLSLQVSPLRYRPDTGQIEALTFIRLALRRQPSPTHGSLSPLAAAERRDRRLGALSAMPAAPERHFLTSPETSLQVAADQTTAHGFVYMDMAGSPRNGGADYLIITPDEYTSEALRLADWKRRKGFVTRIARTSETGNTPEAIYAFLHTAYHTWTPAPGFVLLLGDAAQIPPAPYSGFLGSLSDQIYACLDGDDYFPDVVLGRLPADNLDQCRVLIDKVLAYDRTPLSGDWYESFLSAGFFDDSGDSGFRDDGVADRWFMESLAYMSDFMTQTLGMTGWHAWCTNSSPRDTYYYNNIGYPNRFPVPSPVPQWVVDHWRPSFEASALITTAINDGVGVVVHRDHGTELSWSEPPFSVIQANKLTNGAMTPVVFSMNCNTARFYRPEGNSLCEAFIKNPAGGAVGAIGAVRPSFSGYNDLITHGMWNCFWPGYDPAHNDSRYPLSMRPAEALNYGKYYMRLYMGADDYTEGTFYMFHWLGDPEMSMRTQRPQPIDVLHPVSVTVGIPSDVLIQVSQMGKPLAGALVAVSSAPMDNNYGLDGVGAIVARGVTDAEGQALLSSITMPHEGLCDLVVTHPAAFPYEGRLIVELTSYGALDLDRSVYAGNDVARITLADADLKGVGFHYVTLQAQSGDQETIRLDETGPNTGIFKGDAELALRAGQAGDGFLTVRHGDIITAMYSDNRPGSKNGAEIVTDTAVIDARAPEIDDVVISAIRPSTARITFTTDEPSTAMARLEANDGVQETLLFVSDILSVTHELALHGLRPSTRYLATAIAADGVGNTTVDDNAGAGYVFSTLEKANYYTQLASGAEKEVAFKSLLFTPNTSSSFYSATYVDAYAFPYNPDDGETLEIADDDSVEIVLKNGATLPFFGQSHDRFYIGSNGYVTFGAPNYSARGSYESHFFLPRIAMAYTDLAPMGKGRVSFAQTTNRVVVTFEDVARQDHQDSNNFQVELFFDGRIRLTWLHLDAPEFIWGLSQGLGVPPDFEPSTLTGSGHWVPLTITPTSGMQAMRFQGDTSEGPTWTYALLNESPVTMEWSASSTAPWLQVTPPSGAIEPGASTDIHLALNGHDLDAGTYSALLRIHHFATGSDWTRRADLTISEGMASLALQDASGAPLPSPWEFGGATVGVEREGRLRIVNTDGLRFLNIRNLDVAAWHNDYFTTWLSSDWRIEPNSNWRVENGALVAETRPDNGWLMAQLRKGPWQDVAISAHVAADRKDVVAWLAARMSEDFVMAPEGSPSGTAALLAVRYPGLFQVARQQDGVFETVTPWLSLSPEGQSVTDHDVTFSLSGSTWSVLLDQQTIWSKDVEGAPAPGNVGLLCPPDPVLTRRRFHYFRVMAPIVPGAAPVFSVAERSTLPISVPPGASVDLRVRFRPDRLGEVNDWLYLETNTPEPERAIPLGGEGTLGPAWLLVY